MIDGLFAFGLLPLISLAIEEAAKLQADYECTGPRAWFCDLISSGGDYRILGFNPVWLAFSALFVAVLSYLVRRLATGVAGKIDGTTITVPTWYGTAKIDFSEFDSVEIRSKNFGIVWSASIKPKRRLRLAIWNFQKSDLPYVLKVLASTQPAPPATPPAT